MWNPALITSIIDESTKATKAFFENIREGIEEAKLLASRASSQGGTAGVTGYIGPLVSMAVSKGGIEEAGFLEALESYADGCTPEVELKMETTYAGTTNPGAANISSFLSLYKAIGPKKRHRGHTLIWWAGLAKWAETFAGTEAAFKTQIFAYITEVVEAVGQRVDSWDVLNELTNAGALRQCLYTEQLGKSLTISKTNPVMRFYAECIRVAREANPDAAMFVNEYEIETAFNYGGGQRGTVFLSFVNVLLELAAENPALYGAPDGIGMQFHTKTSRLVTAAELQAIVPKYTEKELVVEITEFDCQIEPGETEAKQEEVYAAMIEGAKKSGIGRVTIWGVTDKRSWLKTQWEVAYKLTSNTAEGVSVLNLTEGEAKKIVKEAAGRQVQVQFKAVTAGCGFSTGTTYYVVGSTANSFELAATEGGAAIKVTAGKTLLAAGTEVSKWGGESSFYPRPCPFSWVGAIKPAWRAIERSRPEQPGVGAWASPTLNGKAEAVAGFAAPGSRTEGLNVRIRGCVVPKAAETITNAEAIMTLPVGCRPSSKQEVVAAITGPVAVLLLIEPSGTVTCSKTLTVEKLRLDGISFPL